MVSSARGFYLRAIASPVNSVQFHTILEQLRANPNPNLTTLTLIIVNFGFYKKNHLNVMIQGQWRKLSEIGTF